MGSITCCRLLCRIGSDATWVFVVVSHGSRTLGGAAADKILTQMHEPAVFLR